MAFKTWLVDTFERAANTFWQTFVVVYIGSVIADPIHSADKGHQLVDLGVGKVALVAAIAALYNVLRNSALPANLGVAAWEDYVVRAGWTFILTAGAVLTADGFSIFNVDGWQTAAVAGAAAVLALVKGWVSQKLRPGTITPLSLAKPAA